MKQQGRYKVTLKHQDPDKTSRKTIDSDPQGVFCFQAKPGDYSVHVNSVYFHRSRKCFYTTGFYYNDQDLHFSFNYTENTFEPLNMEVIVIK